MDMLYLNIYSNDLNISLKELTIASKDFYNIYLKVALIHLKISSNN